MSNHPVEFMVGSKLSYEIARARIQKSVGLILPAIFQYTTHKKNEVSGPYFSISSLSSTLRAQAASTSLFGHGNHLDEKQFHLELERSKLGR